jgi:hypothetical protein
MCQKNNTEIRTSSLVHVDSATVNATAATLALYTVFAIAQTTAGISHLYSHCWSNT